MVSNVGITIRPKAGRNCNVHYHVRASNANALEAKRGVRKYAHKGGEVTPLCSSLAKGQLISKAICQAVDCLKKTNELICFF